MRPGHVEAAKPHPRKLVAGLGEESRADGDEKDDGPGRHQPEILLFVAAERLHLINVGDLERQCRKSRNAPDCEHIKPLETVARDHIRDVNRAPDQHHERELDQANHAGNHDGRVGLGSRLRCGHERRGRKRLGTTIGHV